MGIYREQLLPRLIDKACGGRDLERWRGKVLDGLSGTVVEIGSGSGLNVGVYPSAVTRVLAVEPSEVARRLARRRIESAKVPVEHIGLDGEQLPLDDDSCDGAVSTFTLCTIPDVMQALAELRRVLRPGGRLHFLEHGLSPEPSVVRWQHRLEPMQKRIADGCHLTRDPVQLIIDAGFEMVSHESRQAKGPKPWTWFTEGVAINPA
jgi:ubiquinone/menaquinone biosynthesis C-methylase UbiE